MDFDILAALEDRSIEVETLADKDRMQIEPFLSVSYTFIPNFL